MKVTVAVTVGRWVAVLLGVREFVADNVGVRFGVAVRLLVVVAVNVGVMVGVGDGVAQLLMQGVGVGGCAPLSYAPISHADPYGRGAPR